jgi:hypothetical protein
MDLAWLAINLILAFSIRCVIQSLGAMYTVEHNTTMYALITGMSL